MMFLIFFLTCISLSYSSLAVFTALISVATICFIICMNQDQIENFDNGVLTVADPSVLPEA